MLTEEQYQIIHNHFYIHDIEVSKRGSSIVYRVRRKGPCFVEAPPGYRLISVKIDCERYEPEDPEYGLGWELPLVTTTFERVP